MITIKPAPISNNHLYGLTCRGGYASRYMTKEGKELKEAYQLQIMSQYKGKPIEGDVSLVIRVYYPTKRLPDIDNAQKVIWDSMIGIIIKDDKQIKELHAFKDYDKDNPRVEFLITKC